MQIPKVTYSFGKFFWPAKNLIQLTVGTTLCTLEGRWRFFVSICPSVQLGPLYRPIRSTEPVVAFFMLNKLQGHLFVKLTEEGVWERDDLTVCPPMRCPLRDRYTGSTAFTQSEDGNCIICLKSGNSAFH